MTPDQVDAIIEQWSTARPDLDPGPMAVVFRVKRLARLFERATAKNFAAQGLEPAEFSVLSILRRTGPPHRLSAGKLGQALMLASGSTTNRIDRLEASGLIRRVDDPDDRRGVLVELTALGLRKVEAAVEHHLEIERELVSALSGPQQEQLIGLLRKLLVSLDEPAGEPASDVTVGLAAASEPGKRRRAASTKSPGKGGKRAGE
jgi:DNA-binding MarR family transcriptional regulator